MDPNLLVTPSLLNSTQSSLSSHHQCSCRRLCHRWHNGYRRLGYSTIIYLLVQSNLEKNDLQTFLPISKQLQRYITSWEALAQLCIILTVFQKCETRPGIFDVQSGSDNTGAEANINHGFSTTEILADIIKLVSITQIQCNTVLNVHHIAGEKNIDADNPSRGKLSSFPDELRVYFDLNVIFDRTPFPRYMNKQVQWDPLAKFGDVFLGLGLCCSWLLSHLLFFLCASRSVRIFFFSDVHHDRSSFLLGSMQPITIVKRFLNRTTPSIPLPEDIDDDPAHSESWLLISQSNDDPEAFPTSSATVACQTSALPQLYEKPRSNLEKTRPLHRAEALQPPSFKPKSKLPRLQYGGLQAPEPHCFASSLTTVHTADPPKAETFLRPTAKSLPSPATFRKAVTSLQSTANKDESDAERARSFLHDIFYEIGFSSKLFCEIHNSAFIDQHIDCIADSLGMYVQVWNHWACWCQCHSYPLAEAPLSLVLDYLHAWDHLKRKKDSKPSRTRMMTHIKALRWVALKLDLPVFVALQSQTVSDFLKSQTRIPFERSEATPIPLAVLAAWEQRILSEDLSLPEIITLGCFLIATMASLRFRDLLRTKPETISIQGHILRGISWRTKTSVSGQPWGVCCLGIVTRPSVKHWVFRFLEAIQIGIDKSRNHWGPQWSPHFLFPSWTDAFPFSSPCSYHHALLWFDFIPNAIGLRHRYWLLNKRNTFPHTHSMKSTLLAAAGQLNLNLEQRAKQGHHKKSVQLYSRDDVWPSLFLQRDILVDISTGWRPLTSQSRGAKQPLPEPPFLAPPITQADLQLLQMLQPKLDTNKCEQPPDGTEDQQAPLSDSDSDDTSSSSSSSSSSEEEEEANSSSQSSVLVINDKSHFIHAARALHPDSSKRSCFNTRNTTFEVNCGSSVLWRTHQTCSWSSTWCKNLPT